MTPMTETLPDTELHLEAMVPEETNGSFATVPFPEPAVADGTDIPEEVREALKIESKEAQDSRKLEKKRLKALKKEGKKTLKLKEKKVSAKSQAVTFPMVTLIDEQVRTSIPPELVARVKAVKSKKTIISSNYPYAKVM